MISKPLSTLPGRSRWIAFMLGAFLAFGIALESRAQGQGADEDPPGRAARLSDIDGQVWLLSPDSNEWLGVDRNRPLTTGDRIATDNGARADITLGTTTLRLDSATELEISQLDDGRFIVHLQSGSVSARLRNAQAVAEFAVETDEGRLRAQAPGRYRFDRFEQASDLTVMTGQGVFEGRNSALPLRAGQHAQFWLDAGGVAQYNMVEPVRDAFASWSEERDRAEDRPVAAVRYVSPEMTGAEDLDRYGAWEQTPEYGPLWQPRAVAADWAPYSSGHWAWVRPWGWTWVDDAPWGFAPFHYGRWVYHRNAWCWAPGTYVARPVYAPALVAWVGGPKVGLSISVGGSSGPPVGWFPLAPREVYVPSYRHSDRYVRNINVTHVTNITQITTIVNNTNGAADRRDFANRKFPHAVTVVPASVLTSRQSVGPAAAQYRGNPQIRAFVADARPGPAMNAPPVAAPPAAPRRPEGRAPIRPPFEGRAPGFAGRPGGAGPGQRPGGPGAGGAPSGGTPVAGTLPGNGAPNGGRPEGRPEARPDGRPDGRPEGRPEGNRPGQPTATPPTGQPTAIERPPVRGGIGREPESETPGLRPGMPAVAQRPQGGEAPRPAVVAPAEAPRAPVVAPAAVEPARPAVVAPRETGNARDDRSRDDRSREDRSNRDRRGNGDEQRLQGRPGGLPPGASPRPESVRPDAPRPETPRAVESPRNVEVPRTVAPPPKAEGPRAEAPRGEPPKAEPAKAEPRQPEHRVAKPEPAKREERRDDKRDDKREANEKQR